MNAVRLQNVSYQYRDNHSQKRFNLGSINMEIGEGDFISILGPNGSGKSTLLKLISGFLKPLTGEIYLYGNNFHDMKPKEISRVIAYVPQTLNSVYPYSVYEIVAMGRNPHLNIFGFESENDIKIIKRTLELLELEEFTHKGINQISGGEAQRAFLARALAQEPKIILLDEPNAHLDIKHQIAIFNILKNLNEKEKLTVVSVTHDLNLTGYYSRRAVLLDNGKIFCDDSIKNVLTKENILKVFEVSTDVKIDSDFLSIVVKPC